MNLYSSYIPNKYRKIRTTLLNYQMQIERWKSLTLFVAVSLGYNKYWPGGSMVFVVLCPAGPDGSTVTGSDFKASQKTGPQLKVSSDRLGETGNRTCDPWFKRNRFIPYTTASFCKCKTRKPVP